NALSFMKRFVMGSAKYSSTKTISLTPFKLDVATENEPSHFQVVFALKGLRYRYGFEVDSKAVKAEWLYRTAANKENLLFLREGKNLDVLKGFSEGRELETRTRDNAL